MKTFLQKHLDDIFFFAGISLVIVATYLLSLIAALYVIGVVLIVFGVLIGMGQNKNVK